MQSIRPLCDEFVSCIMPTRDRPKFVAQALRGFLQQTHPLAELVVIDDGEQPIGNMCAALPGVVYLRLDKRTPTGTKMNIGIEHARGSILQKLDDDDYYHPQFLELSTSHLRRTNHRRVIVAWDCFFVLRAGQRSAKFSGHGFAAGGTLCFTRQLWNAKPFRAEMRGCDSAFLRDHGNRVVRVCAPAHYILVRHGQNTWTHMGGGMTTDEYFAAVPAYSVPLRALVAPGDDRFYESLKFRQPQSRGGSAGLVNSQTLPVNSRRATIMRSRVSDTPAAAGEGEDGASDSLAWWKW
jgi:glycosyltransferase involved in cell wall biosynthesis